MFSVLNVYRESMLQLMSILKRVRAMEGQPKRRLGSSCMPQQDLHAPKVFSTHFGYGHHYFTAVVLFRQSKFSPRICVKLMLCNCISIKDRSIKRHTLNCSGFVRKRVSQLRLLNINMGWDLMKNTSFSALNGFESKSAIWEHNDAINEREICPSEAQINCCPDCNEFTCKVGSNFLCWDSIALKLNHLGM